MNVSSIHLHKTSTMIGLSITNFITKTIAFTHVVNRRRYSNSVSKLFTTSTKNEDLTSSEGDTRHVHPFEYISKNILRTDGYLLIDCMNEVKKGSE